MLEQTNETENVETQTTEENVEGIELTDTADTEPVTEEVEEKEESKKTLKELLKENPDYQEEFNQMTKNRLDRKDREFERTLSKYRDVEEVLKSTLGAKDIDEANIKLRKAYEEQGVTLPDVYKPGLSSREIEILAKEEAKEFIEDGYDSMVNEANRSASKGYNNMNEREKIVFTTLGDEITKERDRKELLSIGAKEELLKDKEFINFRNQFVSNVPIKTIFALYKGTQLKPKVENPGSMKNITTTQDVKDFYTFEEASKFTNEDYDKHPGLFEAVEKSSYKWK